MRCQNARVSVSGFITRKIHARETPFCVRNVAALWKVTPLYLQSVIAGNSDGNCYSGVLYMHGWFDAMIEPTCISMHYIIAFHNARIQNVRSIDSFHCCSFD
jgi:hypothetical protein